MSADGIEEREFDTADRYERDIDQLDIDTMLADEARNDLSTVPVRCIVNGHEFQMYRGLTFCRHCGQDQYDEVSPTGMRV